MSGIKDQENIDELRKRLYDRQSTQEELVRHELSDTPIEVSRGWKDTEDPASGQVQNNSAPTNPAPAATTTATAPASQTKDNFHDLDVNQNKSKHPYRLMILLSSLGLFVIAAIVSSVYLFFGANEISTKNVNITMEAPFAVAAGDILPLQLSVTNQNSVPIESAILIMKYPSGTKSVDDGARDLFEERMPIDDIGPGEAVNIPIRIALFGEENEEKEIKATIEYRVRGSNGTFFKDADPVKLKINSSPLVLRIDTVDKISSGQEMDVRIIMQSNASTPLKNILVKANYPNTFSFIRSNPSPDYGQDSWLVDEITPEGDFEIILRGLVSGVTTEVSEIQFTAGNPETGNKSSIGSILTQTQTNYSIERPFIDTDIAVNQKQGSEIVLSSGERTSVRLTSRNTLNETLYDMRVELSPEGSVVREDNFDISSGYYDPNTNDLRWEISGMPNLEQVDPGDSRSFAFTIMPDAKQAAGTFDISAKVFARRVNEARASEELVGTAIVKVKYSSELEIESSVDYSEGPFKNTGPIPPVAGEATTYTVALEAKAGVNDLTNAELTTSLPQYVNWLNVTESEGKVEYNAVAKRLFWNIGDIPANSSKTLYMQVELVPSTTHVNKTLDLINKQEFKAKDDFSGATVEVLGREVKSVVPQAFGLPKNNGAVQPRD